MAQHAGREMRVPYAPLEGHGHGTAPVSTDRAIIWQDDFSEPANWTISAEPGSFPGVTWEVGTGLVSGGQYGTPAIESTTAANGYAMLCSDCGNNQDGDYEKNYLTTADPIDLSAYPYVILEFQTMYRRFNNEQTYIAISTDGVTWPQPPSDTATVDLPVGLYPVWFDGELTQGVAVTNPTVKRINITEAAGGQSQVWVRFYWYGVWGYAWYVDDVNIFEQFTYDTGLESAYISHTGTGDEFGRVPVGQLTGTLNVGGLVNNFGVNPQTNVILHVETRDQDDNVVLTHESSPFDLDPETNFFVDDEVAITAWPAGEYTSTVWISSDDQASDEDAANDTIVRVFEVTPTTYSLDGAGVYPSAMLTSTGTNSFTDNTDAMLCMTLYTVDQNFDVYGLWVGIQSTSVPGALIIASVHDSSSVLLDDVGAPYVTSSDHILTQDEIDAGFAVIPFTDPFTMEPGNGYYAAVELFSNSNETDVRILDDVTIPQPALSSVIFLADGTPNGTFTNGNAYLLRLLADPTIGMNEREELQGVNLFPNPTNGLVNLNFTVPGAYNVEIFNALGQPVSTHRLNGNASIDLSSYAKGVYSVRISNKEKSTVQRISLN